MHVGGGRRPIQLPLERPLLVRDVREVLAARRIPDVEMAVRRSRLGTP